MSILTLANPTPDCYPSPPILMRVASFSSGFSPPPTLLQARKLASGEWMLLRYCASATRLVFINRRFNGGPGCSSLSGLLSENGPFTWEAGTLAPTQNPYTWVNLTNMVWVEQPVGVGYTQGVPNIMNEVQLAQEYLGFWRNFVDTFQMQNYKMYVTGESYGGFYVPYVADAFINANDTTYYNLAGVAINDPIIGDETNQQQSKSLVSQQHLFSC